MVDLTRLNSILAELEKLRRSIANIASGRHTKIIVSDYADNATALAAGLKVGTPYKTGDILKIVH